MANKYNINSGQKIFASKDQIEKAGHKYKPRSVGFKLKDRTNGEILWEYTPISPPSKVGKAGDLAQDTEEEERYIAAKKIYVKLLNPPMYQDTFPDNPEGPKRHMLAVCEKYTHAIAGAVYELRDHINKHIDDNCKLYADGEILARVKINDGADGFGDFSLVSERHDRSAPDHGVTFDFTVMEVWLKPNKKRQQLQKYLKAPHPPF